MQVVFADTDFNQQLSHTNICHLLTYFNFCH